MNDLKQFGAVSENPGDTAGRRALLGRILASQTFHRSARLRELLTDILEHSLAGESAELSEHALGVRLFGRPEVYNPADDNIVRASARQLRLKLKEYFETEGAAEPTVIEIPKGGYTAVFRVRAVEAAPGKSPKFIPLGAALLVASAILVVVLLVAAKPGGAEPRTLFAALARQCPGPVQFVLSDSALVLQNGFLPEPPTVDEYGTRSFIGELEKQPHSEDALRFWRQLSDRQITPLADVMTLSGLLRAHPSLGPRIEVRHARHMTARAFKNGNFILTGSFASNPWADLFEKDMNFRIPRPGGRFENLAPRPGEPGVYRNDPAAGLYAARIALRANLAGEGFVLLLAGTSFVGTEGAGDYVLRPGSLDQIRAALALRGGEPLPPFEIMLETASAQNAASSSRIVAARRLEEKTGSDRTVESKVSLRTPVR